MPSFLIVKTLLFINLYHTITDINAALNFVANLFKKYHFPRNFNTHYVTFSSQNNEVETQNHMTRTIKYNNMKNTVRQYPTLTRNP